MTSAANELRFLRAGLDQIETYLLSRDIYRPIGTSPLPGAPPYPQLTLGNLLLARLKARALVQTPPEKADLERLDQSLENARSRWRANWINKSLAERRARLVLWRDFLEEYWKNSEANFDRYPYEVNRRVLLHLLDKEAEPLPSADIQAVEGLDRLLRAAFLPGEFVWQSALIPSFPKPEFWYLYGSLKKQTQIDNLQITE